MAEINDAISPVTEAEIKEHQAALIRQMVAIGLIICIMLGLHG